MKERPHLTPAEDLVSERTWQWEGITVLTARAVMPRTAGQSRRDKRFDRYYERLAEVYLARCGQKIFPRAAESCREAMARSGPWRMTEAALTYRTEAQTADALVLAFETREGGEVLRQWEEGWERRTFLPLFKSERRATLAAPDGK